MTRPPRPPRWPLVLGRVAVTAVIATALGYQAPEFSTTASIPVAPGFSKAPPLPGHKPARGEADGALPDGVTVFDDRYPGVTRLDPELLRAVREAATDAADDGVTFVVNSGWRSARRQDQLLREAVAEYGSAAEAARWVATADTSRHVSGDAIDIGRSRATAWLSGHGARYGLCQIYKNEPWHYELRTDAIERGCPPMYADPTRDP